MAWLDSDLILSNTNKLISELNNKPSTEYYKGVKDGLLLVKEILNIKNCKNCKYFRPKSNIDYNILGESGLCIKFNKSTTNDDWCKNGEN